MAQIRPFQVRNADEARRRFKGKKLGAGAYRVVFTFPGFKSDKMVVKVDSRVVRSNLDEWDVWQRAKGTPAAKHLVPIIARTADGRCLFQLRLKETMDDVMDRFTERLENASRSPQNYSKIIEQRRTLRRKMSVWLDEVYTAFRAIGIEAGDLHAGNVGIDYDGTFKVLDYGNFRIKRAGQRERSLACDCEVCRPPEESSNNDSDQCQCSICKEARAGESSDDGMTIDTNGEEVCRTCRQWFKGR